MRETLTENFTEPIEHRLYRKLVVFNLFKLFIKNPFQKDFKEEFHLENVNKIYRSIKDYQTGKVIAEKPDRNLGSKARSQYPSLNYFRRA